MAASIRVKLVKKFIDLNEKIFFEPKLKSFYQSIGKINVVIDIGANRGQSIDFFLSLNPSCTLYAIEPNPTLFALLEAKYKPNRNIRLFNFGISDAAGHKMFFENALDYTSSFEELNMDSSYLQKKANVLGVKKENLVINQYMVKTLTLSDFIRHAEITTPIDVVKMDTEGHEYHCIAGAFSHQHTIRFIQLEHHNDDMYRNKFSFDEITKLLEANGFEEMKRIRHGFGNFDEVLFVSTGKQ
ncbi:MAG: FkbM family methyltransferase [Flavobacteriales bacterium]|nr:FkbM family methyltransferase [Flavobacteriales bacterium]